MKKIISIFAGLTIVLCACDLQPKILSLPDSVGEFISARYPALLADPYANPEIYNSAASDYGVYASPNLYGTYDAGDDYVTYASVDDYILPPDATDVVADTGAEIVVAKTDDYLTVPMYGGQEQVATPSQAQVVVVARGDTLYKIAKENNTTVEELAKINDLQPPYSLSVGQKLKLSVGSAEETPVAVADKVANDTLVVARPKVAVQTTTRVAVREITVGAGDTLYSLSRRYSVPVNDLAVMNKLSAPFVLSVGQKLKVPDLTDAKVAAQEQTDPNTKVAVPVSKPVVTTTVVAGGAKVASDKVATVKVAQEPKKISSDPNKKLPKISGRSSSKFSWPVRGKILSAYGAKSSGLFNDGINIGAARGTAVKAAENGVVAYAGNEVKGMGNLIIVQHSDGWMTVYAHMDSMTVRRGTKIAVGQKIGTVGETGKVDKPQLHFEIRKGTKAYNPSSYLKK